MTIKNRGGVFGRNPTFNNVDVDGTLSIAGASVPAPADTLITSNIGSTVQAYDADTAKLDVAQTFTAIQINTAQPAFRSIHAEVANLTGDGTGIDLTGANWTDEYDQGSNFLNGTFTAPVTGIYHFNVSLSLYGVDATAHNNGTLILRASNRDSIFYTSPSDIRNVSLGGSTFVMVADVDMDSGDTCYIRIGVHGGSKTIGVWSTTHFAGHLIC